MVNASHFHCKEIVQGFFSKLLATKNQPGKATAGLSKKKHRAMEDGIIFGFKKHLHDQPVHTRLYKVRKDKGVQSECFHLESVTSGQYFMQARGK